MPRLSSCLPFICSLSLRSKGQIDNNLGGPFPSCLSPLCQNESSYYGNVLSLQVHIHANQTYFLIKGFARGLVLKLRHKVTNYILISQKEQINWFLHHYIKNTKKFLM